MSVRAGLELRGEWAWPKADEMCFPYLMHDEADIPDWVLSQVPGRRTVVQAGGNCGVYGKAYAAAFERLITFEPEPANFFCLVHNVDAPNAFYYRAFLSDVAKEEALAEDTRNGGGNFLWPDPLPAGCSGVSTKVPAMTLDSLALSEVDLIHLDIEGHELYALRGAICTIARCRPWIALEFREQLLERSHASVEGVEGFLSSQNYEFVAEYKHERMYRPR